MLSNLGKRAREKGALVAAKRIKPNDIRHKTTLVAFVCEQKNYEKQNAYTIVINKAALNACSSLEYELTTREEAISAKANAWLDAEHNLYVCPRGGDNYEHLVNANEETVRVTIFRPPEEDFEGKFVVVSGVEVVKKGEKTYINARGVQPTTTRFTVPSRFAEQSLKVVDLVDFDCSAIQTTKQGKPYARLRWCGDHGDMVRCMLWKEHLDDIWRQSFGFGKSDYDKLGNSLSDVLQTASFTGRYDGKDYTIKTITVHEN
jgi:hypothetical protein